MIWEGNGDGEAVAAGGGDRSKRGRSVGGGVVIQTDADEGEVGGGCGPDEVAGEDSQTPGVFRNGSIQGKFGRKIGDSVDDLSLALTGGLDKG